MLVSKTDKVSQKLGLLVSKTDRVSQKLGSEHRRASWQAHMCFFASSFDPFLRLVHAPMLPALKVTLFRLKNNN